jgi:hypothetical protein
MSVFSPLVCRLAQHLLYCHPHPRKLHSSPNAKKALDPQVKKQMLEELRQIHEKEKEEFLKVYTRNPQYTIISHMNSVLTLETPKGELWSFTRID